MKSTLSGKRKFTTAAANGFVLVGVATAVILYSARTPSHVVQAQQNNNKQIVERQISDLVNAVSEVADSYTRSWENKNAPATVEVLKLYKEVTVTGTRQTLEKSLVKPLSKEKVSLLKNVLQGYVENRYGFFMARKSSADISIYGIEDSEYTSNGVLRQWKGKGEGLFTQMWKNDLLYKIEVVKRSGLSNENRIGLKDDVTNLGDFVQDAIAKRFPDVSVDKLKNYSEKSTNNYLKMVDDPASSFEKRLDRGSWKKKVEEFFKVYSKSKENDPAKSETNLIELYESIFGSLFLESFVPIDSALIPEKGSYDGRELITYVREIQDFPNRSKFHALLLNPFVKQRWVEQETANSILKFGIEVVPSQ